MTISREIHVDARVPPHSSLLAVLKSLGRCLLRWPGLHAMRPLVRRALAVTEPAGRMWLKSKPNLPRTHQDQVITVLSANLWHDWPQQRGWPKRLEAFAHLAETERADVLLLQEVARTPALRADEWLARRLGMAYAYSRANGHEAAIGFEEGLAVFSRFPLAAPRLRHLGTGSNPFMRRLALGAVAETPSGNLFVFSVHLGLLRRRNAEQLAHLRSWVAEQANAHPAVIGGDFNVPEHSSQIAYTQCTWLDTFRHLHPKADGTTHELRWPWGGLLRRHRLDYIFLRPGARGWRVLETCHLDAANGPHSDHRAVLTRLEITLA